jgi:hypothetical protein
VFDVQIHSLSYPDVRRACEGLGEQLMERFRVACEEDVNFVRAVTTTTKTAEAFRTRHRTWQNIVRDVTGIDYPMPTALRRD